MNKKITLLLLGLFAVAINAKSAKAFTTPFNLDNESFALDNNNLGANNVSGTSSINATSNPEGFENQFDATDGNTFLLLGANDPSQGINSGTNAAENNINVTARSTFNVDASNISAGTLNFGFDYSFQGTNDTFDSFFVALAPTGNAPNKLILTQPNYGGGNINRNIDISDLTPGNYDLVVSLTESTFAGNSAAAFDNITIQAVPFGAAPNTGIFILGSLYAGSSYLKRRKMSK